MIPSEAEIRQVLREKVVDPEVGMNVVDLGLIYAVQVEGDRVSVDMTLTSPGCPLAGDLASQVEEVLREAFPDHEVEVSLVWEPRWSPEMMSEEARRSFGAP
ncbi:MAG: metal-sulfur cluster assembly factor [Candidatus Bipolaricaulaceae bacterium]